MYYKNRFCIVKYSVISLVVASNLYGAPSGGTVVSGNATISQNANTTNINQSSNKAIINWQDFSIKSNETVNFNQPNVNSITLNRVIGNEKSIIDGALNANGQVWLINSNGVLFGKNAKVNTAGIVASTKDISNEDFNNGNYNFKGNSNESIVNEGEIKSLANTHATFIANSVTNKGKIEVHKGTINLVGASDVTLTLNENQNLSLKVNKGVLDALVDNQNLIVANGGQIYLTTNAKDELLKGVVNHSGIIEASSIDELTQSEVILFAHGGTANIDGTINAKGGFVETSGKNLNVTNNSKIQAKKWLIDPVNVTIDNSNGTVGSEKVGASVIQTTLNNGTNVTIQADNDINVNETISYNKNELTLNAGNNININKDINVTGTGGLYLVYAQANGNTTGDYKVNAKVNLANGTTFKTKKGSDGEINWTVVTADDFHTTLNANKSGNYVLGKDITLSGTNNWTAIGESVIGNRFTGKFDGLGHTISNLNIDKSSEDYQGLFGYTSGATIKNIGLENATITGLNFVGGLVGLNYYSTVSNSYATVSVNGNNKVGGLVGDNNDNSTISNSYATGTVDGNDYVGGLVGNNYNSTISNSYATGTVDGNDYVGGLVGVNEINSTISNSYATGTVIGTANYVGGLVGYNYYNSTISNSYATVSVNGNNRVGGLVGYNTNNSTISNSYASGTVSGNYYVGGLVGLNNNSTISNSYANGSVSGTDSVGGLVGLNYYSTVSNSYATGTVDGNDYVGGLVGDNNDNSTISNSYATGTVDGNDYVGGLVGYQFNGTISNSFYDNQANTASMNDSSLGRTKAQILTALTGKDGWITNGSDAEGYGTDTILLPQLQTFYKPTNTLFQSGYGTSTNPYTITNWTQLQNINNANILTQNYYFNLLNNLSNSTSDYTSLASNTANGGLGWNSIGWDYTNYFKGTFDGLGYTISNLNIDKSSANYQGLFGYTSGATIKNIGLENATITGLNFVGGLVGLNYYSTVSNSYATVSVNGNNKVGGLVGDNNDNSTISNSYATGTVDGNDYVGGLVGNNYNSTISNSYATGTVDGNDYVGGLVGVNEIDSTISNSYATGTVIGTANYVGGLVGYNYYNSTISNSYATVSVNGNNRVGGLVGYNTNNSTISNSYASGTVSGNYYVGGLVGLNNNSTISNSYANGSVSGTDSVGGLVGLNYYSTVSNSYATGTVDGNDYVGGLVGDNNDNSTISNSYATGTVIGTANYVGGLVGYQFNGTISNSFYDKTKNPNYNNGLGVGKTTQELSYGETFKNASWDIVADSSVTSLTPVIKWDSINNKYVWAIAPLALTYTLADKTTTYNGTTQNLSTFYNNPTNIFGTNHSFIDLSKYKFQVSGSDVTGYKDADIYNNIKLVNDSDSFAILNASGNTDGKLTINKKDLTISAITANNKTYDGTTTATVDKGVIDYTGKFGTDDIAIDATNLVATFIDKNVGTHQVNISGITLSGADANNYNVVAPNSLTASITQKDLTISNITANNKTYDGTTTATLSNIGTLVGLVTGEDLVLNNPTSVIFSSKDVADGITVTASGYTIADKDSFKASNYNLLDTSKTTTANISKADLTATLNDNSKTYDGTSYSGGNGITFNGFVNGETASLLGGNLVYSGTSQGAKDAGNYIISGSGLTSNNYNISFVNGKLTINKKDLTISNITANNKTYDGTTTATLSNIGTLVGLVTGENLVLNNPTSVIFSSKDVADGITVTASGYTIADKDSFKASNYNLLDTSKTTTANIVASVNPTPNPTPSDNNQKPKVDEKVQRVIASIEPSTNSNSSSNQSVPNSLNSNIRTLSFNGVDETRVINGGVKMPDDIVNSLDEL